MTDASDVQMADADDVPADDIDMRIEDAADQLTDDTTESDERCQCCGRMSTATYDICVRRRAGKCVKRVVSLYRGRTDSAVLCNICSLYTSDNGHHVRTSLWRHGWAAAIACMLVGRQDASMRHALWRLLPSRHRDCWRRLAAGVSLDASVAPDFEDYTAQLVRFNALTTSGKIDDFLAANDEYAFPTVRCPAGCFAYMDECTALPFHHFLAWKYGKVIFNGSARFLSGARPDWPTGTRQLGAFDVMPGVVVDEDKGLCVLVCRQHGAKGLCKTMLHIPTNPVLDDYGLQCPDTCAAAMLSPKVIRAGRMGR